ncbi:uromodulin-like 1-like [Scleropages formosus]|uniref:Uromodulin-like 1-like n=1 Tax=Scleropages formosus TaxID=113540 RepID=A0A0P7UH27_SCLFO|nr:uromodulin-like 1-like [Scleropages formosus]
MSYKVSYKEWRPCGGWLPVKTCQRTLFKTIYRTVLLNVTKETIKCCDGFEQLDLNFASVALTALSRTAEFSARPGHCPRNPSGAWGPQCEWDTDCPGFQKCCQGGNFSYCTNPVAAERRWCLNVTVTVKADFDMLQSLDEGILNHTRLLHSLVTGALGSPFLSVHHVYSQSAGPLNTLSSLLLCSSQSLSASHTAGQLQQLLQRIEEVISIEVKDTDECAHVELNNCSPEALCRNTEGMYSCTCRPGFTDLSPNSTGTQCQGTCQVQTDTATTVEDARIVIQKSTSEDPGVHAMPMEWNSTATAAAPGPPLFNVQVTNVTSSTFSVTWTVHTLPGQPSPMESINHTFQVLLLQESQVLRSTEVMVPFWVATNLEPGVLYTVRIVPSGCTNNSTPVEEHVRTGKFQSRVQQEILKAKTRLSNVQFRETLLNSSSQDYRDLCRSIQSEIRRSLSGDILALLDLGVVKIQIVDLAPGSVVVSYVIVFRPEEKLDISNVSFALLTSLQNSSKYIVDNRNSSVEDFDECFSRQIDCSPFALCVNTWGSFKCICPDGFIDTNPDRLGRTCEVSSWNRTDSSGNPAVSSGNPTFSSGNPTVSSGSPAVSSGNPAFSSGNPTVSSGSPAVSSGNPAFSSGNPTVSSGSPAVSSGNPAVTSKSSNSVSLVRDPSRSGAVTVECKANEIFVTVAREFLRIRSIAESSLYLGRPDCGVTYGNESHVQLNATWEKCNTQIDMIKDIVEGSGTFHVSFQLLNGTFPLPQNHTLSPNEEVVIEIGINTTVPQLKLITKRCWATPSSNPLDTTSYEFLKNGCPVTGTFTTVLQNGNSSRSRLSVRIFSVVEEIVIYLHCQIQICVETTADICKSDCRERTERTANIVGTSRASCGPIYKSPNGSSTGKTASFQDVGLIILGLALVLLTILVALAVIFYYRSRIGHYNFSFKQKQEKFTYHIFDT